MTVYYNKSDVNMVSLLSRNLLFAVLTLLRVML